MLIRSEVVFGVADYGASSGDEVTLTVARLVLENNVQGVNDAGDVCGGCQWVKGDSL